MKLAGGIPSLIAPPKHSPQALAQGVCKLLQVLSGPTAVARPGSQEMSLLWPGTEWLLPCTTAVAEAGTGIRCCCSWAPWFYCSCCQAPTQLPAPISQSNILISFWGEI